MATSMLTTPDVEISSEIDTPYHSSSNSHRHNYTVSSISHISRATIHDDELPAPVEFNLDQKTDDPDNDEGDKHVFIDRPVSAGHNRSKSANVDQSRLSIPSRFESFSSSVGFTSSAVRRPSVACLKVNVNAARAGKHRIEHIESPALVLESGFDEGQTDPDKPVSTCSSKSKKPSPSHRRPTRHRLAIPEDTSAPTDPWSAYLDTSCDSASNFIPSHPKSRGRNNRSDVGMEKSNRQLQTQAKSHSATAHMQKNSKHLLSFIVGEHSIALSEKQHQQVVVIEPKAQAAQAQEDSSSAFIISQGKSIGEALRKLSLESNSPSLKAPPSPRAAHFSRKDIARLRKTLVQICTLIVDEAVRNVYDESKYRRRQQRKQARRKESINEVLSTVLTKTLSNWTTTQMRPRQKKSWNTTESCSELSTEETSADDVYTMSDDQSAIPEHIRSVLQR